ncbi:MAG: hypothetical protein WDZ74_02475 [Candidatus Paceibacterota bacterium]
MSTSVITPQIQIDAFDEYVHTGGLLSREEFQGSLSAIKSPHGLRNRHPTPLQAQLLLKRLALVCRLGSFELAASVERLYIVLRSKYTLPCSTLRDEPLFSQALLMLRCYEAATLFEGKNSLPQK